MNTKKIWIVSELFYPDEASTGYIMTVIAKSISENKDVHVICGPVGYDKISASNKNENFKFTIHRVKTVNFDKNNILGRFIRLIFLSTGMFIKGLFSVRKNDTVFIVTNPAFVIPFYSFIKWMKHNELIYLVHDVFPENLIPSGIVKSKNNFFYKVTKTLFDWSYRQADLLIVLGSDMLEVMKIKTRNAVRVMIIENWANVNDIKPSPFSSNVLINKYGLQDKIVFTFAGNLGRVQGLEFLFKIIKKISNPKVHFLFIGEGALLKSLIQEKNKCVTFAGSMPRSEQQNFLNAAHLGLVTLSGDLYGLGVPSKTYNIMAAGKAILFIGNKKSEIGNMVITEGCGFAFDESEEAEIINFFDELDTNSVLQINDMGLRSRFLAENRYSQSSILNKFKEVL